MTKDAFIAKHLDEIIGLLVGAFAAEIESARFADGAGAQERVDASKGRFIMDQMRRARGLLGRMYDDLNQLPPPPEPKKEKPR